MAVVRFRVGPPGSGKSYSLVWEIVADWSTTHGGPVYCNLPLKLEEIEKYFAERRIDAPEIHIIPPSVLDEWTDAADNYKEQKNRNGGEILGPWSYFADKDLAGAWIIIDEVHNFVSTEHAIEVGRRWKKWLGEIRHTGAVIDFCSQSEDKVARAIKQHAPVRIEMLNAEDRRDPICGIKIWDWYQLKAKFIGSWKPTVWRLEAQKVFGRFKAIKTDRISLDDSIFALYDSFSAPIAGGQSGKQPQPWERATWPQLIKWFILRNFINLFLRFMVVVAVLWLVCGGGTWAFRKFMDTAIAGLTGGKSPVPANATAAENHTASPPGGGLSSTPPLLLDAPPQSQPLQATLIGSGNKTLVALYNEKRYVLKQGQTWNTLTIVSVTSKGALCQRGSESFCWWLGAQIVPDPLQTSTGRLPSPQPPPSPPGASPSKANGPFGPKAALNGPAK